MKSLKENRNPDHTFDTTNIFRLRSSFCDLDMLLPLDSAWPKNGTATKLKNNAGYKVTTVTTIVTVSTFVVFFACCLSPTGVNATSLDVDHEGNIELGEFDHERAKREIKTHEGKRLTTKLVAELGTRPRHLYSFGIGK